MNIVRPHPSLLLVGWLAQACAHTGEETPRAIPPAPIQIERVASTRISGQAEQFHALMSEQFGFAASARNAMIRGDMPAVREALLALADYPYTDSVPGTWLPRIVALQDGARATARHDDVESLAQGIANLALACGDCHHATGGGLAASVVTREEARRTDTLPDRMFRHDRAAEQMWLGLIAPSSAAWNDGARRLAQASIEVEVHGEPPAGFSQALHHVRFLGSTAERLKTNDDRAQVYARLLRSCADCHRAPLGPLH